VSEDYQEYAEKNQEPKDDVEGHRLVEKEEVVEEPDVEGHRLVENADYVEYNE
jgi:hypothetical protein